MEVNVKNKLQELLKAVRSSSECVRFRNARMKLDEYPQKRSRTNEFRKKNFLFQNPDEDHLAAEKVLLYHEREELRSDEIIDEYLKAELSLCRLLRRISIEILNVEDLGLDDMYDIL